MAEVLFVGKPVAPPWNDSSKNLARDVALSLTRHRAIVLSRPGVALEGVTCEPIHRGISPTDFGSNLGDQARVLWRLLRGGREDLWHFFFAPNPRTSHVGRLTTCLRNIPSVHTVASAPRDLDRARRWLFADRTVVLSRKTEADLIAAGASRTQLCRIPPGIEPLVPLGPEERAAARQAFGIPADALCVVYPGDLEFGRGAFLAIEALSASPRSDLHLVLACRRKTTRAEVVERELRSRILASGLASRVTWIGETPKIHALLDAADVVLLTTDSLYAKMDYPLVVLEAMSLARPVLVAEHTAVAELADEGAVAAVIPHGDAIADRLATLFDEDVRRELGDAARTVVLRRYTRHRMATAYETLYDELLAR